MGKARVLSAMKNGSRAVPERSTRDTSATTAVVSTMSRLRGKQPVDLEFCLADDVDSDALDALFAPGRDAAVELRLTVDDCEVRVQKTGTELTVVAREGDRQARTVVDR
jgi:hypothetical protein